MSKPTEDIWEAVVDGFWEKTQFPNFIGALDGKHITVKKLPHSGLWTSSTIHEERLKIPPSRPLPCTEEPSLPLVMVADEAFGLAQNLMRPYSGYGLSHLQKKCIIIGSNREFCCPVCSLMWQMPLKWSWHVAFCTTFCGTMREAMLNRSQSQRVQFIDLQLTARVMTIRNQFAEFFVSPDGEVSWQNDYV